MPVISCDSTEFSTMTESAAEAEAIAVGAHQAVLVEFGDVRVAKRFMQTVCVAEE